VGGKASLPSHCPLAARVEEVSLMLVTMAMFVWLPVLTEVSLT